MGKAPVKAGGKRKHLVRRPSADGQGRSTQSPAGLPPGNWKLDDDLETTQRLHQIVEQLPGIVAWEWSIPDGSIRYSENISAVVRGNKVDPYCSLGQLMEEIHPEDRDGLQQALERTSTRGRPFECEYRVRMVDGVYRWILGKGGTVVFEDGKPVRVLGLSMDITERKEAEEKLRRSEALYRAIGESIDYGVWVCSTDGRNVYASDSFLRLVGMTQEQCSNFGWGDVLHPEDAKRTIASWKECVQVEGHWDIEHRFRGVDGQWHPILARGVPVKNERGEVICWAGINLDISRLKQAEQALQEAQAKLQAHADELERKVARRTAKLQETVADLEHFSYAITHDLRAPLRAMQGFASLLDEECARDERSSMRDYSRRIRIAAERLDRLITDSLNYGKTIRQEFKEEPVDLGELIPGMIETYPNLQPDKAQVTITGTLPVVTGNKAALTQCFSNLLDNAAKFTKPGTKPDIRIRSEHLASPNPGGRVRVWVEDSGIGIPAECQGRIFNLFQRATTGPEGTGIGLAIVHKVVERMGGRVGVESREGEGSRFWIELRISEPGISIPS